MLFEKIGKETWLDLMKTEQINLLYAQSTFHERITNAYHSSCSYFAVTDKSGIVLALPILHRSKDASFLTHFFYQYIFINEQLSERKRIEALNLLVESLLKLFDKIDFKFDTNFNDIRAFTWNGFQNSTYYTYIIQLTEQLNYSDNINRQLKKYKSDYYVDVVEDIKDVQHYIQVQIDDMIKNGMSTKERKSIERWLMESIKSKQADLFQLKNNENTSIGSAIYLKDDSKAYLIATMSKDASQVLLYDYVFNYYKSQGLQSIDLLGGNIPNIAIYKSQFDAQLKSYIIVSYRKNKLWEQIKSTLKLKIKSMLNK